MLQAEQITQGKRLIDFIESGTTSTAEAIYPNPVEDYVSEEQAAQEMQTLIHGRPLVLAASVQLPGPNTFLAHDLSGQPIVLTRDGEGKVRTFLNVCRHRGARVAEGCGTAKRFVCPYHAWTYAADGRLVARPDDQAFEGAEKATHGLRALPCVEKYGLIFVQPSPGADFDVDSMLGGLAPELEACGLQDFVHYKTYDAEWRINWKLGIDTFLESYHFNVLHHSSISPILHSNLGAFDAFGENLRLLFARRTLIDLKDQPEADWDLPRHATGVYILFPNTVLVRQGQHVELWQAFPNGTDKTQFRMTMLIPKAAETESAIRHWERNFDLLLKTVEEEDFPVGEGVQQSFRSGAQSHITFGRNEPALHHFHKTIRKALNLPPITQGKQA
jgi:phenylpropionate dioxygenase-like ring-hydroxylating dioxygenase large terminal subunit